MKNYILSLYRKLPIDFRKKVKNIFVKEPEVKEILNQEEFLYALKKYDVIMWRSLRSMRLFLLIYLIP